jgi:hypothetical protein
VDQAEDLIGRANPRQGGYRTRFAYEPAVERVEEAEIEKNYGEIRAPLPIRGTDRRHPSAEAGRQRAI